MPRIGQRTRRMASGAPERPVGGRARMSGPKTRPRAEDAALARALEIARAPLPELDEADERELEALTNRRREPDADDS